jgi:hypothetical protein
MRQAFAGTVVAAMLVGILTASQPTLAASTPAGVWIELHFAHADGQTKTITEAVPLRRAGMVKGYCNTELPSERDFAHGAFLSHPELAHMTFTGANCVTDKSGKFKMVGAAWPAGGR